MRHVNLETGHVPRACLRGETCLFPSSRSFVTCLDQRSLCVSVWDGRRVELL